MSVDTDQSQPTVHAPGQPTGQAAAAPDGIPGPLPRHVAIIMDGNGRWARNRGLPRLAGHHAGAKSVRTLVRECGRLGIEALTMYSFSSENWKRPAEEVGGLMDLCREHLVSEADELRRNGVRFRAIGRLDALPQDIQNRLAELTAATAEGQQLTLSMALNYGSRAEIVDAMRSIARQVADGTLSPEAIDEASIDANLYTTGLPDPDLLIRTAGEMRLSNYLLWQISYAEFYVTPTLWPDFGIEQFHAALRDYAGRSRRFGGLEPPA